MLRPVRDRIYRPEQKQRRYHSRRSPPRREQPSSPLYGTVGGREHDYALNLGKATNGIAVMPAHAIGFTLTTRARRDDEGMRNSLDKCRSGRPPDGGFDPLGMPNLGALRAIGQHFVNNQPNRIDKFFTRSYDA